MENKVVQQVYVGKTTLSEESFFKLFDFQYENFDEIDLLCMFSILMECGWFDEDYLLISFKKNGSLKYFLNDVSDLVVFDVDENLIDNYKDIDFIVLIDAYNSVSKEPNTKLFKNNMLEIKYLGEFTKN